MPPPAAAGMAAPCSASRAGSGKVLRRRRRRGGGRRGMRRRRPQLAPLAMARRRCSAGGGMILPPQRHSTADTPCSAPQVSGETGVKARWQHRLRQIGQLELPFNTVQRVIGCGGYHVSLRSGAAPVAVEPATNAPRHSREETTSGGCDGHCRAAADTVRVWQPFRKWRILRAGITISANGATQARERPHANRT